MENERRRELVNDLFAAPSGGVAFEEDPLGCGGREALVPLNDLSITDDRRDDLNEPPHPSDSRPDFAAERQRQPHDDGPGVVLFAELRDAFTQAFGVLEVDRLDRLRGDPERVADSDADATQAKV